MSDTMNQAISSSTAQFKDYTNSFYPAPVREFVMSLVYTVQMGIEVGACTYS
jgi:hypothetical protein